jgi:hypothetical protein
MSISKLTPLGVAAAISCIASAAQAQSYVVDDPVLVAPPVSYYVAPEPAPLLAPASVVSVQEVVPPPTTYAAPTVIIAQPATVAPPERVIRERVVREEIVAPGERVARRRESAPHRTHVIRQRTAIIPHERMVRERIVREEVAPPPSRRLSRPARSWWRRELQASSPPAFRRSRAAAFLI